MGFYKELGDRLEKWLKEKIKVVDTKVESIAKYHKYVNTELDYCYLRPDTTVGDISISEGSIVPFIVYNGNMEYNPENYSVKLKGGKTYKIESDMYSYNDTNYVNYILYDITNNVELYLGTKISTNLSNNASQDSLTYVYTPIDDCEIQIKINTPSKSMKIAAGKAYFSVQEINRQITIDPVEHVNESQGIEDTPVGHIIAHMGITAPKHYLICDGKIYNISDYPYLAQHIEDNFGKINYFGGDGTTTFAVPDLRGEFLRGTGTAARNTGSGSGVGVHQEPTQHARIQNYDNKTIAIDVGAPGWGTNNPDKIVTINTKTRYYKDVGIQNSTSTSSVLTSRPTNTAVLYCIKYEPTYFMQVQNTNYLQPSLYSEEERIIGCWTNGKPLYQKTFKTILPEASSNGVMATTTEDCADFNIDIVTSFNGFFASDITTNAAMTLTDGNGFTTSWYNIEQKLLYIGNGTVAWNGRTVYLTIQYTKVTDEENSFTNDMLKDSYVELTYSNEEIASMVADILGGEE